MAYEAVAIGIFIIILLIAIVVFIALLYSIYSRDHDDDEDNCDTPWYDWTNINFHHNSKSKTKNTLSIEEKINSLTNNIDNCSHFNTNISSNTIINDDLINNKLIILEGTNKFNITISTSNNTNNGAVINIFNNSNKSQMLTLSDKNEEILVDQIVILEFEDGSWNVINKFGGNKHIDTSISIEEQLKKLLKTN